MKLSPQLAKKILSLKIKTRGMDLKKMADYVLREGGKEKLRAVEGLLEKVEYPMPYEKIKDIRVYTLGERLLYVLAIKEVMGWDLNKIKEMGYFVGRSLIIIKFFSHLFRLSNKFFYTVLPEIGSRYIEGAKLIPLEGEMKNKKAVFKIEGLDLRKTSDLQEVEKIGMVYFEGFFTGWAQMILGVEKVRCKVKKSENGYIFNITWI